MLALVSPAKKLDFESDVPVTAHSDMRFRDEALDLAKILGDKSKAEIKSLMSLSDNLAQLNYDRYQGFDQDFTPETSRAAAYAFKGDTYVGLDAYSLDKDDMAFAQEHLGILSGLYGLLRPLDLMQPYRLEMGTKLNTPKGEDLYDFWGGKITQACNDVVKDHKDNSIICLASNEYIKSVQKKDLDGAFVTCDFKDVKNGEAKTIGLFAKRARGAMARFMIQNRVETPEGLKDFDTDGYAFRDDLSDKKTLTFVRDQER